MATRMHNLFDALPPAGAGEEFVTLFENRAVKIERIVSHGCQSPEGFWYDQAQDEWVIVLRGQATLEFAGGELVHMNPGDHVAIPKHRKHRVARTEGQTIWLAVHCRGADDASG